MTLQDHPTIPDAEPDAVLTVRPWWDPLLAIEGHPVSGEYTERFWLGILGPSVICLLRRLARGFETHPEGFLIVHSDTARAIGLGAGNGRQAPFNRTIERACTFNTMRRVSPDVLDVRLHLPTLTPRQLSRLPLAVRTSHQRLVQSETDSSSSGDSPSAPQDSSSRNRVLTPNPVAPPEFSPSTSEKNAGPAMSI